MTEAGGLELEQVRKGLNKFSSEVDVALQDMKKAAPIQAECDVNGGRSEVLTNSDWDEVLSYFQAIVNLAFVHTGQDHIFYDPFDALSHDSDKRRYLRKRPGFGSNNNQGCSACGNNNPRPNSGKVGGKTVDEDAGGARGGDMAFHQFVNNYVAAVVTFLHPLTAHPNLRPYAANCTFS
jgi:hypothetical protein